VYDARAVEKLEQEVVPILILCAAIAFVVRRLPRVEITHSDAFRRRRVLNWLPLGLTYAFLYMGRYNFNGLVDGHLISKSDFGDIDGIGQIVYGLAFLINGPLTDRLGGRFAILMAAAGAGAANAVIGISIAASGHAPSFGVLMLLNTLNMYFQSFGAVAIVKVNASWFHLRERGTFGGIFGILISLGIYLAFDWAPKIAALTSLEWLFLTPAVLLAIFWVLSFLWVRDTPATAGFEDFDVADASSGETGPPDKALTIIGRMLTNRVIMTIALVAMCSGFLRMGILKWVRTFASGVGVKESFGAVHWGMLSCIAGITGGIFAGVISDHVFHSRRPPVAAALFSIALVTIGAMFALLAYPESIMWVAAFMLMSILGIHGMLSGVASQDFGGRRNAGTATGMIDGFVYFGGAFQAFVYGNVLPTGKDAADTNNWRVWPLAMVPLAVIGLGLSLSIYKAVVKSKNSH
jgi:OPA family glycerol-3-phosphate transporter-like MFS transporter